MPALPLLPHRLNPQRHKLMEAPDLEPIEFELPNGHSVRVEYLVFLDQPTRAQRLEGVAPRKYSAICIFSTEESPTRRYELCDELRSGTTFDEKYEQRIWQWIEAMLAARRHRAYDWAEEFVDDLQAAIAQICAEGEDAVEHYEQLPGQEPEPLVDEADFDPGDDSHYNDQNESAGDLPISHQKPL